MTDPLQAANNLDRYVRQMRYPPIGEQGQQALAKSRALICGCGALGSVSANTLCRSGVGFLRIVDRDFLETNNLQRQVLYDEQDVAAQIPKAIAAQAKLNRINSQVQIEAIVADVDHTNILSMAEDVDMVIDGTDNFETRFLINDAAIKLGKPWVYGGCIGAEGQSMTIVPGTTPCLTCVIQDCPPPGTAPTCDTAGIVGPIVNVIASIQALEAIKILSGNRDSINRTLTAIEMWDNRIRQIELNGLLDDSNCTTCQRKEFPWLDGTRGSHSAVLCGRNSIQLSRLDSGLTDLDALADKLAGVGQVSRNRYLLRLAVEDYMITVFPDGRSIVGGTDDISVAKTVYAKYIGS